MRVKSLTKSVVAGFTASILFVSQATADFRIGDAVMELSSPTYIRGKEMHTLSGGGVRFRIRDETFRPFSIVPPSIRTGCGGIDITFGSFSYFNMEQLGRFLQNTMEGAPVVAFQLAMHTVCPQCEQLLSKLTSLANQINQIGFNKCQIMSLASSMGKQWIEQNLHSSEHMDSLRGFNNWVNRTTDQIRKLERKIAEYCPQGDCILGLLLRLDQKPVSLVSVAVDKGDIPPSIATLLNIQNDDNRKTKFKALIRYYFGDVILKPPDSQSETGPKPIPEPASVLPSQMLTNLVYGDLTTTLYGVGFDENEGKIKEGKEEIEVRPLKHTVSSLTTSIKTKIKNRIPLDNKEMALILSLPAPVISLFNVASVEEGLLDAVFDSIDEYLASELAYSIIQGIHKGLSRWGGACLRELNEEEMEACKEWQSFMGEASKELFKKRLEYQKRLSEKLQTANVVHSLQARIMGQLASSPLYGNYIYSQMLRTVR